MMKAIYLVAYVERGGAFEYIMKHLEHPDED